MTYSAQDHLLKKIKRTSKNFLVAASYRIKASERAKIMKNEREQVEGLMRNINHLLRGGNKMKRLLSLALAGGILLSTFTVALADSSVRGYFKKNGTYVQPHYRSTPDRSFRNNWSTYPNVNPHTGRIGTRRSPDSKFYTPKYRSPRSFSPNRYQYRNNW